MKKVFALLSVFLLTLAFIGILSNPSKSAVAAGKWTVDPTLAADEVPVYVMNSIYTTFPHAYDNAAQNDDKWESPRLYPWNETRLRLSILDDDGNNLTGTDKDGNAMSQFYAIYFAGLTNAFESTTGDPANGAGVGILAYDYDSTGQLVSKGATNAVGGYKDPMYVGTPYENVYWQMIPGGTTDPFTKQYQYVPGSPSVSHMRTNITGVNIEIDAFNSVFGEAGKRLYSRGLVFNAAGKAVWGTTTQGAFAEDGSLGAQFCYSNGQLVRYVPGIKVDNKMIPLLDEHGQAVLDPDLNPIMVESDEPNFFYHRFLWEFFAEAPENVNEANYMEEGWDANLWDLCYPEGEGYIAIAFLQAAGTDHKITVEQAQISNATYIANDRLDLLFDIEAMQRQAQPISYYRQCCNKIRIPAGGFTYDFGYLESVNAGIQYMYDAMFKTAFLYGRSDNYAAVQQTFDFSMSGLKTLDVVRDKTSYQLLQDRKTNVIEVIKGSKFKPSANIVATGLASRFVEPGNVFSYSCNLDDLEYTGRINGGVVFQKYEYNNAQEMVDDFFKDYQAWLLANPTVVADGKTVEKALADVGGTVTQLNMYPALADTTSAAAQAVGTPNINCWLLIAQNANPGTMTFFANEDMLKKWSWLLEYISATVIKNDPTATTVKGYFDTAAKSGYAASPSTFSVELFGFFNGIQAYTSGVAKAKVNWAIEANQTGFIPTETNLENWQNYQIDTTDMAVGSSVTFTAEIKNTITGMSSKISIQYVIIASEDDYTPILVLNKENLLIYQVKDSAGNIKTPSINAYGKFADDDGDAKSGLVTVYDACYAHSNIPQTILGADISWKVQYSSPTIPDFDKPKAGKHQITATVYNESGKKSVSKTFTFEVYDLEAPTVKVRQSIAIPFGTIFNSRDAVIEAWDNADGNLMTSNVDWCQLEGSINTNIAGTYPVRIAVYDSYGNHTLSDNIDVIVLPKTITQSELNAQTALLQEVLDEIAEGTLFASEDTLTAIANLLKQINKANDEIATINEQLTNIQDVIDTIDNQTAPGCKKKSGYFVEFLAAASLLVLVLRKKEN